MAVERSAVSGRVLLLACAALLAGPTPSSYGGGSTPLNLDSARASEVVGGVGANIVWPGANNWGQSYDNLRFTSCQNTMMNAAGHNNDDYAHIYVVETLACWNGLHLPNSNGKKWTAIVDTEGPQGGKEFRGTTVLSHELGHTQGLGHVTASWANCGAGSNLNRNLMCLNGGRLLQNSSLPQQCDIIRSSTGFHDFN